MGICDGLSSLVPQLMRLMQVSDGGEMRSCERMKQDQGDHVFEIVSLSKLGDGAKAELYSLSTRLPDYSWISLPVALRIWG